MPVETRYLPVGDTGLMVEFGSEISLEVNQKVRYMSLALEENPPQGVREIIPAYCSLLVHYEPDVIAADKLITGLKDIESRLTEMEFPSPAVTEIPVLYGGEQGPDLQFVAEHNGLTPEKVIALHSSVNYLIYMIGFAPGFPYLGGMPEGIATPRLKKPRLNIPAGSVGIAGKQTGIYPLESPGGWRLIGQTPVKLYNPGGKDPILLKAGDFVRFKPVGEEEYTNVVNEIVAGSYEVKRWELL